MKHKTLFAVGWMILGAVIGAAAVIAPRAYAQGHPVPKVSHVMTQFVDDLGKEVRMERVDFAPGAESPAHRHPGHVFVYVLQGEVVSALGTAAPQSYKAGASFYEPANGLHAIAKNPSATESASILVFHIADKDKPSTVLDKH